MRADDIIQAVAVEHGVAARDILGPRRYPELVNARRTVARALRAQGWTWSRIGRAMGRDHATVMWWVVGTGACDSGVRG